MNHTLKIFIKSHFVTFLLSLSLSCLPAAVSVLLAPFPFGVCSWENQRCKFVNLCSLYETLHYPNMLIIDWKGSSWCLGCVFSNIRYVSLLWLSALKLAKKFNSTSFNLKQEVFIRRDEEKTRRGLIYTGGKNLTPILDQRVWPVKVNLHTLFRWFSDLWSVSHSVESCCN